MTQSEFAETYGRLPSPFLLLSREGIIDAANTDAAELLGRRAGELTGTDIRTLVADPADKVDAYLRRWQVSPEFTPGALTWRSVRETPLQTRCYGGLAARNDDAERRKILLRLADPDVTNARFLALNRTVAQLGSEVRRRQRTERLLAAQNEILALIARDTPVREVLERLTKLIEEFSVAGVAASVLLLDRDGAHLRDGAGPSLPAAYRSAIDGLAIGPAVGSCGTAAYRREPVVVSDIASDPLWKDYRDVALAHGLRACWSTPIVSGADLLGTFALYNREPAPPSPEDEELVRLVTRTAAIAIERDRAQERLRSTLDRQTAILNALPAGIALLDHRGSILAVNETWADWANHCGMSIDATRVGADFLSVCNSVFCSPAGETEFRAGLTAVLQGSCDAFASECACLVRGAERWYRVSAAPLRRQSPGTRGVVVMHNDITDRRHAEAALLAQASELARSNSDLQQFAYVASHDLREPLRTLQSFSQLFVRRYSNQLGADAQEYLGYIESGVRRMQDLIDDLLVYSRVLYAGDPQRSYAPLAAAVETARRNLHVSIQESGAEIACGNLPSLMLNHTQMVQVFQNLIANAIKYHGPEPPRIEIKAEGTPAQWTITVADNGAGIDPRYHETIFGLFKRLHSRDVPGTGIGLALCKKVIESHNGKIWVESAPGLGSRFRFTLPAEQAAVSAPVSF